MMRREWSDVERRSIEAIIGALNDAKVRHLIVGGLAVVAHGYGRVTQDVDLVLDPDPDALRRAVAALSALGYGPRAPVPFAAFEDAATRAKWASEKAMTVFSLWSRAHEQTPVDLFLEPPFEFDAAHARAMRTTTESGIELAFVSLEDLLAMKRKAGRPLDLVDVSELESIDRPEDP